MGAQEKATIMFRGSKGLARVFTLVPSILPVKILIVQPYIHGYEQLQNLTTRPHGTFMHLRHMTCQLIVFSGRPNADNGILQLARCLMLRPDWRRCIWIPVLKTILDRLIANLEVQMVYLNLDDGGSDEVMEEEEGSHMCHHDHMHLHESGFRCYNAQVKLAAASCRMVVFLSTWKYSQGSRPVCLPSRIMASSVLCRRSADGHSLPRSASVPLKLLTN